MLYLGSQSATKKSEPDNDKRNMLDRNKELTRMAKEKHFEVLELYNLTLNASSPNGERYGLGVALIEAMIVVNWLAMLPAS